MVKNEGQVKNNRMLLGVIAILLLLNGYTFFKYFDYSMRYSHCIDNEHIVNEDLSNFVKSITCVKKSEVVNILDKEGVNYTIDSLSNTIRLQLLTIQFGEEGFINSIQQ